MVIDKWIETLTLIKMKNDYTLKRDDGRGLYMHAAMIHYGSYMAWKLQAADCGPIKGISRSLVSYQSFSSEKYAVPSL